MKSRSFAKFTSQKGFGRADGLSIGFVCGRTLQECDNVKLTIEKIGTFYAASDIVTLTISLYDSTGSLLTLDKVAHKYLANVASISAEYQEDECYPHCHMNTNFRERKTIEKSVVMSECRHIISFLRKHSDRFKYLKTVTFICCHCINIPDDVAFLLRMSPELTLIQKLDHTGTGPVFDLSEKPSNHGYTPWRYRASLTIEAGH